MNRIIVSLFLLFSTAEVCADISGYALSAPVLDAEIHPRLVAAAPNGNVWFAQQTTIGFFTPSGHVTTFPIPCAKCSTGEETIIVWALAAARDNTVWFIDNHAKSDGSSIDSSVGHVTATGTFNVFAIPTANGTAKVLDSFGHSSLALAADGSVWFTENAAFKAGKLTPSTGAIAEYPLEMPEKPSGITVGPDGRIWYTVDDHEIAQITPPTNGEFVEFSLASGAQPLSLVIGADGNLWVTEAGRHKIARFQPGLGVVTEFSLPVPLGQPQHIISASNGQLWYTEGRGMDVGRITLTAQSTPMIESISTPGFENFDLTVSGSTIYFTGRDVATQQDKLMMLVPYTPPKRHRSAGH